MLSSPISPSHGGTTNYFLIIMLIWGPQHGITSNYSVICYISVRGMLKQGWDVCHWDGNDFQTLSKLFNQSALVEAFQRLNIILYGLSRRTSKDSSSQQRVRNFRVEKSMADKRTRSKPGLGVKGEPSMLNNTFNYK